MPKGNRTSKALALGHEDSEAEPPRGHDEPVSSHDDASTSPEPLAEAVDYESSEEPSPSEDSAASLRILGPGYVYAKPLH